MGKYDKVTPGLPRLPGEGGPFQERVDQAKAAIAAQTRKSGDLALRYSELRKVEDDLARQKSDLHVLITAHEQLLWEALENEGLSAVKLADGTGVSVQTEPYVSVKDAAALLRWARANGLEGKLALPWQTVNSVAKERLLDGLPTPDGVELFSRTTTVLRRA